MVGEDYFTQPKSMTPIFLYGRKVFDKNINVYNNIIQGENPHLARDENTE